MNTTKLLVVLLATAGVLCDEVATEEEKTLECGAGEFLFEGSCWWIDNNGLYTWAKAEDACKWRNMSFASIHSETEKNFVFAMAEGMNCWSGLSDAAQEGEFRWSDGTLVDYLNWAEGQPDGGDAWDCVYTEASTGEWRDISCDSLAGVVCRSQPSCGRGQTLLEGSCWWIDGNYNYTWAEAEIECRSRNLTQTSIHSQQENYFISALTARRQTWIGLTDAAKEDEWQWTDGTPVDYLNWYIGEPNGWEDENCAFMDGVDTAGEWGDFSCDKHAGVVCRGHPFYEQQKTGQEGGLES